MWTVQVCEILKSAVMEYSRVVQHSQAIALLGLLSFQWEMGALILRESNAHSWFSPFTKGHRVKLVVEGSLLRRPSLFLEEAEHQASLLI